MTGALAGLAPDELLAGLVRGGFEGPRAFIRALDADYDRQVAATAMARPLDPEDDLRLVVGEGDHTRWVFAERLGWDSEFFGRGIARLDALVAPGGAPSLRADGEPEAQALTALLGEARARSVEYLFCTVAPQNLPLMRALFATGFELIETRSHYHMPLGGPPQTRYETRLATSEDVPSLARAARTMVNPFDRFHADLEISEVDADRMMERWVEASIDSGFADATVVPDVDAPEAFCTAKYHQEHWEGWGLRLGQPVLSAVAPRHRGWYLKIISELNEHLRSVGAEHSWLVTQITNNAVIRSWEKLGYQFGKGEHVFRKVL